MRDHPIPPVTEPMQYRAIGLVRAIYAPFDLDQFTRGKLIDQNGDEIEAVVLGRVMSLMRKHLQLEIPHLWVVYPRCRKEDALHLQISGIWEPSTLALNGNSEKKVIGAAESALLDSDDVLQEGDDYFSIRGELIFTNPDKNDLVVKVRQKPKPDGKRAIPFKIKMKGNLPFNLIRNFVSFQARRVGQQLHVEDYEIIGPVSSERVKRNNDKSRNRF